MFIFVLTSGKHVRASGSLVIQGRSVGYKSFVWQHKQYPNGRNKVQCLNIERICKLPSVYNLNLNLILALFVCFTPRNNDYCLNRFFQRGLVFLRHYPGLNEEMHSRRIRNH